MRVCLRMCVRTDRGEAVKVGQGSLCMRKPGLIQIFVPAAGMFFFFTTLFCFFLFRSLDCFGVFFSREAVGLF